MSSRQLSPPPVVPLRVFTTPVTDLILRAYSKAVHSKCSRFKDHRRRAGRSTKGECGHSCQFQRGERGLER